MSANRSIRLHVEELFLHAPKSHRTIELKEELISNLQEKYDDLVAQGRDQDMAYDMVISSIGDIDELIRGLQEKYIYDPDVMAEEKRRSAMLVSVSVALYISSMIPVAIGNSLPFRYSTSIGGMFMVLFWALATGILVYNNMTKPKYTKDGDNMVEDFKEWSRSKKHRRAVMSSVTSIVWLMAVIIFIGGGMIFGGWHLLWMVFLLAAVVQQIIRLVFLQTGMEDYDPEQKKRD